MRDDIAGGLVTLVYGRTRLTQWREINVDARITIVPASGVAEDVKFGRATAVGRRPRRLDVDPELA